MILIDGISFDCEWVKDSLKMTADIINGDNSTRTQGSKEMYLEYLGTFFNFSGQIIRGKTQPKADWYKLWALLSNPVNKHTFKLPYDDGFITQQMYTSAVERTLKQNDAEGNPKWETVYEVTLVAIKPARKPNQPGISGYSAS